MRDLEVSDCEMQEGSLRCDANINLHIPVGSQIVATPIVEVKNLNSFRAVERALRYEAGRQYEEYRRTGLTIDQAPKATAGWDEHRSVTVLQRRKEEAADYRYFPDPDLVPVVVEPAWADSVRAGLGELPAAARRRLQLQHELSAYDAGVITAQGRPFVHYFEEVANSGGDAKEASNWVTNQVLAILNDRKLAITEFPLTADNLGGLLRRAREIGLNAQRTREAFARMVETGESAQEAIDRLGFKVIADEEHLRTIVRQAISANSKAAADYKRGKARAADAIKGAVMRETRGMARIEIVQKLLLEELENM